MHKPPTQLSHAGRMNRRSVVGAIAIMFLLIAFWLLCDEHTWRSAGRRLTPADARLREEPADSQPATVDHAENSAPD